jgi:hypothetical protein
MEIGLSTSWLADCSKHPASVLVLFEYVNGWQAHLGAKISTKG